MRSTSNINSSLSKRRRLSFLKKVGYTVIFVLFFISLFILGLTSDRVQIKSISVSGNLSVSKDDILNVVEKILDARYLFIVRTDNFFLLKRKEIEKEILNKIKKIQTVDLSFSNLNSVEVSVLERVAKSVWCDSMLSNKKCYFMDENGFIFTVAPDFSSNPFPIYFGLINDSAPIGQSYFNSARFKEINQFFQILKTMKFSPVSFNALNEHQHEVYLLSGGKIIIDDKKTFDKDIVNLQALIDNGFLRTDSISLKKIKNIDLRFGNKVILK